ncbi:hypothetical protein D3C72_1171520 [compost metagenome]
MLPGLPGQIFGCTVQRLKMVAMGKEEVAYRLKRHLPEGPMHLDGNRSLLQLGTPVTQARGQRLQPLGIGQVTLVHGQQCLRQLRQPGCDLAQLRQRHSTFRRRHGGHGIAQPGQQARLLVFGELLNVHAQHLVNLEQHRHGERALVLLDLVEIAGR